MFLNSPEIDRGLCVLLCLKHDVVCYLCDVLGSSKIEFFIVY